MSIEAELVRSAVQAALEQSTGGNPVGITVVVTEASNGINGVTYNVAFKQAELTVETT